MGVLESLVFVLWSLLVFIRHPTYSHPPAHPPTLSRSSQERIFTIMIGNLISRLDDPSVDGLLGGWVGGWFDLFDPLTFHYLVSLVPHTCLFPIPPTHPPQRP